MGSLSSPVFASGGGADLGAVLPAWSCLPFLGMLLTIALFPLLASHFWHHHYSKISLVWALIFSAPFVFYYRGIAVHEILHMVIVDYLPFIILVGTLFTIGSGVLIRGTFSGSPKNNVVILSIGTFLASWIGTTGAAMLLIRPLLRANRERCYKAHTVVFFIFLVANVGGCLTPLGDPPLFLGFLHGVPFFWTLTIWKEMLTVAALLLVLYALLDGFFWRKEKLAIRSKEGKPVERLKIEGGHNFLWLGGVLLAVAVSGVWHPGEVNIFGVKQGIQNLVRDIILIGILAASWFGTNPRIHRENEHLWEPIREVAILFAGIFITMIPALAILRAGEQGAMAFVIRAIKEPYQFFWITGGLSSFLDNAPTYLTFLSTALGKIYPGIPERAAVLQLAMENHVFLQAIATGAVFMGANTYIGNAPNFMIKSIAEKSGVKMPSFFGYIFRYTLVFLIPVFVFVTWLFF